MERTRRRKKQDKEWGQEDYCGCSSGRFLTRNDDVFYLSLFFCQLLCILWKSETPWWILCSLTKYTRTQSNSWPHSSIYCFLFQPQLNALVATLLAHLKSLLNSHCTRLILSRSVYLLPCFVLALKRAVKISYYSSKVFDYDSTLFISRTLIRNSICETFYKWL